MKGGSTRTNICGWGGGLQGTGGGNRKCLGGRRAKRPPLPTRGSRCLNCPNSTSSPPTSNHGGQVIFGSFACVGRPWVSGVWSVSGGRGSGPQRGRRSWGLGASTHRLPTGRRMPDWCTASPPAPSPSPRPPQPPQPGDPRSRIPPTPDEHRQALGGNVPYPQHARHGMVSVF